MKEVNTNNGLSKGPLKRFDWHKKSKVRNDWLLENLNPSSSDKNEKGEEKLQKESVQLSRYVRLFFCLLFRLEQL